MANEAVSSGVSQEALDIAKKQGTLRYQIVRNRASYFMIAPYFILFFFFTVLPVLMSIGLSFTYFNMLELPTFVGWKNYIKLFLEDDVFLISLKNTLIFTVVTGPVSYMLCLLFAWIINEFRGKLRAFLTLIFYAPSICGNAYLVWNLILTGDRYGYLNGILLKLDIINEAKLWMQTEKYILPVLIVVQLWLSLGTGFLSFIAGLQTVDTQVYEAAAIDGVNAWQKFWKITFPLIGPFFTINLVLTMKNALGTFDQVVALTDGGPNSKTETVTYLIWKGGLTGGEYAYQTANAVLFFIVLAIIAFIQLQFFGSKEKV